MQGCASQRGHGDQQAKNLGFAFTQKDDCINMISTYQHDINIIVSYLHHIFIMMNHRIFHKLMTYLTYHDLAPWFSRENFSQLGKTHQQGPGQHRLLVVDAETKGLAHGK